MLVGLGLPVFFWGLGDYSVVDADEGFYHYVARHMLESGNWLRLEFTGEHRLYDTFLNAPLHYWAKALLIALFGDSLWTMRLLASSFGLLSVLLTCALVTRIASVRAGLLAGLAQLVSFQFVYLHSARTGEMETLISFFLTLAAWLFLRALEPGRSFVPHHLCILVLAHLKLPLALVPLLAELAWFAIQPRERARLRPWLLSGLVLAPLVLLWRAPQALAHWDEFVGVVDKMLGQAGSGDPRPAQLGTSAWGRALFYAGVLLFGAFPLSLFHPIALFDTLRRPEGERDAARFRLLALFAGAVVGLFLFVSKHFPWYIVPVYPFLSAFLGTWLDRLARRPLGAGMVCALAVAAAVTLSLRIPIFELNPFGGTLRAPGPVSWAGWGLLGAGLAAGLLLAAGLGWRRLAPERLRAPVLAAALAATLLSLGLLRVLAPLRFTDYESPLARLRREVDETLERGEELPDPVVYVKPPGEPGTMKLRYYFGDDFRIVRVPRESAEPAGRATSKGAVVHLYRRAL